MEPHRDVLQEDAAAPLVLEAHQLLGVLPLLVAVVLEEAGEAGQRDVVPVEVEGLRGDDAHRATASLRVPSTAPGSVVNAPKGTVRLPPTRCCSLVAPKQQT